jgi:hypothetical protein
MVGCQVKDLEGKGRIQIGVLSQKLPEGTKENRQILGMSRDPAETLAKTYV